MVRVVVLQESRITVRAAPPPQIQGSFSRPPRTHRVSREVNTCPECCQNKVGRLRIFTGNVRTPISATIEEFIDVATLCPCGAVLGWRFAGKFFEYAIELRQRLKTDRERNFAYAKIRIVQETTRFLESCAGNVFDKVNPGHPLELLAQMIPTDADCLCNSWQRKLFLEMFIDEISRPPNFHRFRPIAFSAEALRGLSRIQHIHN